MSFKKLDKEFCLTDDSVNVYGYRCLTNGLDLSRFNPPIGFLMHNRDGGVAVRWEDFRIDEGKLFAKPCVNTTRYPLLADEIESGFYQGASVGKIVALETTDDEKYRLEGQTGVTVLRWFPRECSIVDIPGNYSALAQLYDDNDNVLLDLSDNRDNNLNNKEEMDKKPLSSSDLKLLDLADNATEAQISARLIDLADKASRTEKAETDLQNLKDSMEAEKVESILTKGLADKKLTKENAEILKKDYAGKSKELQSLVDSMPAQVIVSKNLDGKVPEKYAGKSFRELYVSGDLADVKENYPELYEQLSNAIK